MLSKNHSYIDFTREHISLPLNVTDNNAATAVNDQVDYVRSSGGGYLELCQNLASTNGVAIASFIPSTYGMLIASDGAAEGVEYTEGITTGRVYRSFTVGTDPAFFIQGTFKTTTIANSLLYMVGFRTLGAYDAAFATKADHLTAYADAASIGTGDAAGTVYSHFSKAGADTSTAATHAVIAASTWVTLRVDVSATGVVSYKIGSSLVSQALAEAALAADTLLAVPSQTMTSAVVVVPSVCHIGTVGGAGDLRWLRYTCGWA